MIDGQDRINIGWTYLARNDHFFGFRTVITINAAPVMNDAGEKEDWTLNPNTVVELEGRALHGEFDPENPEGLANAQVVIVDPIDPAVLLPKIETHISSVVDGIDLGWTRQNNLAVSGRSKQESRKAWDKRLIKEKDPLELLYETFFTNLLHAVGIAIGLDLSEFYIDAELLIDADFASLEMFTAQLDANERGLASDETVVATNPAVADTEAELNRLEAQKAERKKEQIEEEERNNGRVDSLLERQRQRGNSQ